MVLTSVICQSLVLLVLVNGQSLVLISRLRWSKVNNFALSLDACECGTEQCDECLLKWTPPTGTEVK